MVAKVVISCRCRYLQNVQRPFYVPETKSCGGAKETYESNRLTPDGSLL